MLPNQTGHSDSFADLRDMRMIERIFPFLQWAKAYNRHLLVSDFSAGLTVAVMIIPQGLAYAMIVGLPPVYGLYASIFPALLYALLGTSRQLSVGPTAMDSLMVAAGISVLATQGTSEYIHLAIMLAFFMGLFQVLFGLLRMGFIANLLSRPVISGFTSAAAVIISLNQVKNLIGVEGKSSNQVLDILAGLIPWLPHTHWVTLAIGLMSIALIYFIRKWSVHAPGALIAVILGTALVYYFQLDQRGVAVVKDIPTGFPAFQLPMLDMATFLKLAPLAITLALVAFMETFSVARTMESKRKDHKVKPNQELIAMGASNIFGSFFQSFPVTGGFGRTAINFEAGGRTPVASLVSSGFVALILLFFTPLFFFLPKAILAAVILMSMVTLFDLLYARQLWHDSKWEFALLIGTFLVTLHFGMFIGIITGIVLSILLLLYRTGNPHIARLGRVNGHHEFRNIKRFKNLETWENLLILRIDAPLGFMNIQYVKDYIENAVQAEPKVEKVIIDASPVSHLDATAISGIRDIHDHLNGKNVKLIFCDLIGPVRDVMFHTGLIQMIGEEHVFIDLNDAVTNETNGSSHEIALQHGEL